MSQIRRKRKFIVLVVVCAALVVGGVVLTDVLLRTDRFKRALARRLVAAFGRPAEVANFELSLLGGPRIAARYVTIEEDPRFGHEYFIRAERLTASLRWHALLRGRLEFGTISISRPSLNLVRLPDGQWNITAWLAPPGRPLQGPAAGVPAPRLSRIEIDDGRINFKRGVEKHPFALVAMTGNFEKQESGGWRVDLEAQPMRAGVIVQQAGTLRVRGSLGGPHSRLEPAELRAQWEEAAVADALRLARGRDFGVRGNLAVELLASAPAPQGAQARDLTDARRWSFTGAARLAGVHRWDLPPRSSDPGVNINVVADWWPEQARVEIRQGTLEAPGSNIRISGFVRWAQESAAAQGTRPARLPPDSSFRFVSAGISLNDLFTWYRAFRPGVPEATRLEGNAGIDMEIRGWPLRIERAVMATGGGRLRSDTDNPDDGIRLGRAVLNYEREARGRPGRIELSPAQITVGASSDGDHPASSSAGLLRLDGWTAPRDGWKMEWNLAGHTDNARRLARLATRLGLPVETPESSESSLAPGPATLRFRWKGTLFPLSAERTGSFQVSGVVRR